MKRLLRPTLSLLFVVGFIIAIWPLGQMAYGRWSQYTLQAAWREAAAQRQGDKKTRRGSSMARPHKENSALLASPHPRVASSRRSPVAEWPPTRIIIPEIDLDAVVIQGWDEATLRQAPGHHPRTGLPGQPGNCVIAAHRNVFGAWFRRVDALFPGSEIKLRTPHETFTYYVTMLYSVADTDKSVLQPPADKNAPPRLTLVTCPLHRSTSRIIVVAELAPPESPSQSF